MTATDRFIAELRALADKATPGWRRIGRESGVRDNFTPEGAIAVVGPYPPFAFGATIAAFPRTGMSDASLFAAFDPTTLKLVLDVVEKTHGHIEGSATFIELIEANDALEAHLKERAK